MTLHRRRFLRLAGAAVALPAVSRGALAQAYPARPVKLVIGYPPGGSADITARLVAQFLGERLGQPLIVESRPGAGTNIATETVINAPADGYTLLLVAPANAINATLYEKLNHNYLRDTAQIAGLIRFPNVIVVHPSVPVTTVPELIALPEGQSRQAQHGLVRQRLDHPYVGRAVQDDDRHRHDPRAVSRRRACADRSDRRAGADHVRQCADRGRVHQVRQAARARRDQHDALPCVAGSSDGRRYRAGLRGKRVVRPRRAEEHAARTSSAGSIREVNALLADPKAQARFAELGAILLPGTAAEFGKLVADETEKWGKVVKFAGAKVT